MNVKVLLAGVTGYIGQSLVASLASDYTLYTISKYPKRQKQPDVNWIRGDIYNYSDVLNAMNGIDVAVFYIDPTKHSAKMTRALARELNLIAADNFARAAFTQNVKEILYISGSKFDHETVSQLRAYGTPVRTTSQKMNRPHISVEFQVAKHNDIRIVHHIPKPLDWGLEQVIDQFVKWLTQTKGTRLVAYKKGNEIKVYQKKKGKLLAIFRIESIDEKLYRLVMVKGRLSRSVAGKNTIIEFRHIPQTNWVMIHLFDYVPRVIWPIAYFIQVPYLIMLIRGFDTKCRIQTYQERLQKGENLHYTKD
ncbi:hypothetical protein DOS70_04305 [Staphylococcus felis]|uniref:NAD(P)-binding domain-containing protein n=1 Tax=Staphylococcus felis TaxID=46127 RepID=A0A3E0IQR1_9STAP|nr:NAD(P)H-binding protein [Staphylococcus felis]MDM8327466.1 NAD(P)H-binding protein [Staphylococcus felis]MDQ7193145.1 NAD(P)H-binding protein [Staphylococcus felis]REH79579.1 hypothetical protein DOS57_02755 [Staphylococcus felis]REH79974.1 hypothetical protein DOS59_02465 [Staphylococcus felis]REH85508.1 hypothetical protein DOS61_04085 [Staphylococcus felis]